MALNAGDARKAIELLKPAFTYEKANTIAIYVRGMAYLKAKQGSEASAASSAF